MRCKRFKQALFGLVKSPFFLARTLKQHLETCGGKHVEEIMRSVYMLIPSSLEKIWLMKYMC